MTIQPTAVYPPGVPPPSSGGGGQQGRTYVIYDQPPTEGRFTGGAKRMWDRIPDQPRRAQLPQQLPGFLKGGALNNRSVVFNAWIVAMVVIGFDEWHNLGILPRPARLWDASLVYGVLVLLGFADIMVPIANALAIGYTIMLIWQYYNGNITPVGNVARTPVTQATGTTQAPGTTTAGGRG